MNKIIILATVFVAILVTPGVSQDEQPWLKEQQIPGLAMASKTADIATVVSQQLTSIRVKEGDTVTKGQLLATLEYSVVLAEYEAAKAIANDRSGVEVAMIDVQETKGKMQRMQGAFSSGATNALEIEKSRNEYTKALAILEQQKSLLVRAAKTAQTAKAQVEGFMIRAPFDGIVVEQHFSVGNFVRSGDPVFSVVAPAKLRAELNLPLSLFGKLKAGETIELTGGAPVSDLVEGQLKFVSPGIDSASQTFRCVFMIDNHDHRLPAGFPIQLGDEQLTEIATREVDPHETMVVK